MAELPKHSKSCKNTDKDRTHRFLVDASAVNNCLPIFAAGGDSNYLRSAYFYVQEMSQLYTTYPDVFQKIFSNVIRLSSNFWACNKTTLMKSLNSSRGLTHGSGMSEQQRPY